MNDRLWYPQLDVFDCVRRLGALLQAYTEPPGIERVCIADFYLANPPLLHWTHMRQNTRSSFYKLRIVTPKRAFLSYPAPPLLFSKMAPVQKGALRAMGGKGLVSFTELQRGIASLTDSGREAFGGTVDALLGEGELELLRFLAGEFAAVSEVGSVELRKATGLRRST